MRIQAVSVRNFNIEFRFRFDSTTPGSMIQYGLTISFVMPNHLFHNESSAIADLRLISIVHGVYDLHAANANTALSSSRGV